MPAALTTTLPPVADQAERLVALGVHEVAGLSARELRDCAARVEDTGVLLVLSPDLAPASALAPLLELRGRRGFVVADMTDVDAFAPIEQVELPAGPVYGLADLDRGDAMANRSPHEALPALTGAGRTPLTLTEGIHWVLQVPGVLDRNRCFMTIGSRRRRANGVLDARTPALWISNGTGRDGRERRDAPKVGWCWAGNRHTWLGFASAQRRVPAA
ncbi:DUF5701 family protein [Geodermatophilus sp. SYSU D00742]